MCVWTGFPGVMNWTLISLNSSTDELTLTGNWRCHHLVTFVQLVFHPPQTTIIQIAPAPSNLYIILKAYILSLSPTYYSVVQFQFETIILVISKIYSLFVDHEKNRFPVLKTKDKKPQETRKCSHIDHQLLVKATKASTST